MKPEISFDDFTKLDLRIGTILSAKKVEKADKLLHLTVDVGLRQIELVSGIALHFSPEELPGKQVTVLLNLEPRKIRGVMSQGMVLMIENEKGQLKLLCPDADTVAPGSVIS